MEESSYSADSRSQTNTEGVVQFWQQFNLDAKRIEWDKIGNEMRDYKTASINGRKRLNEMTKSFRARPKEEQLLAVSELLKAYQEEIDQLSKRSRFTEASFASIHKALYDAPDPAPCMESLSNTISNGTMHSLEIERLKSEIRQYDEEFQRLKNQDITIRRLEDQLQEYKDNLEEKIVEEAERRVRVVREQCEQQLAESNDAQRSAERRMQQAIDSAKQAQQSVDRIQSQLFEEHQKMEARITAMSMEHNTFLDQNQRLSLRIAELENERNNLLTTQNTTNASSLGPSNNQQWQVQREAQEKLLQQLQDQLRGAEDQARQDRAKHDSIARELQHTVSKEREHVQRLKGELSRAVSRAQYNALRREAKTLRRIAFHTEEQDNDDDDENEEGDEDVEGFDVDAMNGEDFRGMGEDNRDDDIDRSHRNTLLDDTMTPEKTTPYQTPIKRNKSTRQSAVQQQQKKQKKPVNTVEELLMKRLRIVEHELVVSRSELVEAKLQESLAKESLEKVKATLEVTQIQLQRVEQDLEQRSVALEQLLTSQTNPGNSAESADYGASTRSKMDDELAQLLLGSEPTNSNNSSRSNRNTTAQRLTMTNQSGAAENNNGDGNNGESMHLMVKVLQSQRDRTKERLATYESRLLTMQQQLDHEIAQKQQLEQDNLSLYRKVKFLQSYNSSHAGGEGRYIDDPYRISDRDSNRSSSMINGDVESRYSAMYEARLSPFAEFSSAEKQRKWRELSTADRIVLNTAMAVVTNSTGRTFLLIYFGAMHLLVFGTMYYLAHSVPHTSMVQCITDPHQAQLH